MATGTGLQILDKENEEGVITRMPCFWMKEKIYLQGFFVSIEGDPIALRNA